MVSRRNLQTPPIVDAVVELRFDSDSPSQVAAALLFNRLKEHGYNEFEELPVAQMPAEIRDKEENFRYMGHYRIKNSDYVVNISNRVVAIACKCAGGYRYKGWEYFRDETMKVLSSFNELNLTESFTQTGVRYINFFNDSHQILDKINIRIKAPNSEYFTDEQSIGYVLKDGDMFSKVTFATQARVSFDNNKTMLMGAILDIDAYTKQKTHYATVLKNIESCHAFAENIFFDALKDDFIETLARKKEPADARF